MHVTETPELGQAAIPSHPGIKSCRVHYKVSLIVNFSVHFWVFLIIYMGFRPREVVQRLRSDISIYFHLSRGPDLNSQTIFRCEVFYFCVFKLPRISFVSLKASPSSLTSSI